MDKVPEPALVRENVQDYPRPPAIEPVVQRLRVFLNSIAAADTVRGWRICETHHPPTYYFPPEDILDGALVPAPGGSFCEWKGRAVYYDLQCDGVISHRAAWSYPEPTAAYRDIAGFVAFFPQRVEVCLVGDVVAEAQPGDFYGGWVTPNLRGIVKGGPGTEGW